MTGGSKGMMDRRQVAQQEADVDLHQAREAFEAAVRQAEEAYKRRCGHAEE